MKHRRLIAFVGAISMTLAWLCLPQRSAAQKVMAGELALITTTPIEAMLSTKEGELSLKGQLSIELESDADAASLRVRMLNLVFPEVGQRALTGIAPQAQQTGVLGISLPAAHETYRLAYDARSRTASGKIPVQAHYPQLDEIFPQQSAGGSEQDYFVPRTQPGTATLKLQFPEPVAALASRVDQTKGEIKFEGEGSLALELEPIQDQRTLLASFSIKAGLPRVAWRAQSLKFMRTGWSLCVQPVRIRSNATDPNPTGAGLAFGMPGANTEWGKARIRFDVRDWMQITNANLKIASAGTEENQIRAAVDVADCIEVFFVENFTPVDLHGGGATWSSGTASAKIITSDGNAAGGIDLTHLAHEFGHVLNMGHPGDQFLYDPSTNTLMCPSGWRRDNPARNSRDNAANATNPLLTATFAPSGTPDCTSSSDCGSCP